MKITDRMAGDHKTFRKIMMELDAASAGSQNGTDNRRLIRLVELFYDHLVIHAWGEETFYYPVVRKAVETAPVSRVTADYLDRLDEEHRAVDGLLAQLEKEVKENPPAPGWTQTYARFCQNLNSHMKREEEELFPFSEKLLGEEQLELLSLELERRRTEAPKARVHIRLDAKDAI